MESLQLAYRAAPGEGILQRIGNTPLIRLRRVTAGLPAGVEVHAKAEWFNPGGSVKDRPALAMIREGERTGKLGPGKVILDATIFEDGTVHDLSIVQGHPVLAKSAVEAVRRWRYKPYELNGKPVKAKTTITVDFKMPSDSSAR